MTRPRRGELRRPGSRPTERRDPKKIKSVLQSVLHRAGIDEEVARYNFVLHWPEVVGKDIAERTRPECFRDKTLVVRVCNSTWAQELSFQKDVIIGRLKKFLGADQDISDIHFYVGELA